MNMEQLLYESTLSESERTLLLYLLNNVDSCIEKGIRAVAKENFVSTSSIMRLAKKLNYNGYTGMLYDFKFNYNNNKNQPYHASDLIYHNETICEENIKAFIETLKCQNIVLFGAGYSEIVCQYIYKKLLVNNLCSYNASGLKLNSFLHHKNITIESVLLVSRTGVTPYIVQTAQQAKEQGISVISFTGNMKNPTKELSDIAFVIEDWYKFDYDYSEYTPFFGQTILLFEKLLNLYKTKI
ncbi:MAG: MurR/RpiR family transcriptional regulator [Lachnospiraceae bacterium]|nr:MurR/RpiR family transcriptional regulator [Lachnospiraceae bacterium]